jgi:hypothetical protein
MVPSIAMNSDNDAKHSSGPDGASTAKPATKIRIIEDADATGKHGRNGCGLRLLARRVGETAGSWHHQMLRSSA